MDKLYGVIARNEELLDLSTNSNSIFLPNGVDLKQFKPDTTTERTEGVFKVGFAGNVDNDVRKLFKGFNFIEQACKDLGVELKPALCGNNIVPHAQMPEFYRSLDCLVSASESEGCSNSISEALACGVAVLLTETGYHGNMLKQYDDCLFVERTVKSIRDNIKMLQRFPAIKNKLGIESRKFVEKNQDIENQIDTYKSLIEGCILENE